MRRQNQNLGKNVMVSFAWESYILVYSYTLKYNAVTVFCPDWCHNIQAGSMLHADVAKTNTDTHRKPNIHIQYK